MKLRRPNGKSHAATRTACGTTTTALAAVVLSGPTVLVAQAAESAYPARPVRLVIPFPPGGGTDLIARVVGQRLSERWRQPVLMDNRPGGTTVIGAEIVAKAAPDGYTLLVTPVPFTIVPSLGQKLPFDPVRDFEPIALFNTVPLVIVLNPSVPAHTVKQLIVLGRSRPGALNFGSSGAGSSNHLAGELFNVMTGVQIVHIPYKGSAPVLADLVGGHVDLAVTTLTSAVGLIKAGKVRAIGVTSLKRSPAMPSLPTIDESGLRGYEAVAWNGLSAPARTDRDLVTRINADVAAVLQLPDVVERLRSEGAEPAIVSAATFKAFIESEIAKWAKVVQFAGGRLN